MEDDGNGMHCICFKDFCNHLSDRRVQSAGKCIVYDVIFTYYF